MKLSIAHKTLKTPILPSGRSGRPMVGCSGRRSHTAAGNHQARNTCELAPPGLATKGEQISFKWLFPNAKQVNIAGSFNNWQTAATPLKDCGDGSWLLELALQPGRYEYRFVIDGKWTDDPLSPGCTPNPFGGHNSVLVVNAQNGKN